LVDTRSRLFPDAATRAAVTAEEPRLPFAYYEQSVPVPVVGRGRRADSVHGGAALRSPCRAGSPAARSARLASGGSSGKRGIDEQAAPDGPDGMGDEQRQEQARVAVRHEQHALVLIEAAHRRVDHIHHPGPEGWIRISHGKKRRDHAFVLPHSECIGDVTPRQGTDGRAMHRNEYGPHHAALLERARLGGRPSGKTNDRTHRTMSALSLATIPLHLKAQLGVRAALRVSRIEL
jgi:hypothetical protein